ncbi:MAG: GNAT family N-acetyltransferase [Planctomycetota bacterium]|jgi:GNAT superfamily N-acetyltransferase
MPVTVRPVRSKKDLSTFIRLPWRIYRGDPVWVPPLISSEKKLLDRARNPFFGHAEAEYFLAEDGGRTVGRIAAIIDRNHVRIHEEKCGFFGFFECEDSAEYAAALFKAVEEWHRSKGMEKTRGPANPSFNDPCGFVIDGFEHPPFVLMTYNPRYYPGLVEGLGYAKCMDMFAYLIHRETLEKKKIGRIADRLQKRGRVTMRTVDMGRFEDELHTVMDIYNSAWTKNWGFVPMTEEEIRFAANDMKAVLLPELAFFAEQEGKAVGFALALPDINRALKKCNGRLLPFGWIRFLKFNLRRIDSFRVVALGVRPESEQAGIGTLFYLRYMEDGARRGYKMAELSWILESNAKMNSVIRQTGAEVYKTYRIYEKCLRV